MKSNLIASSITYADFNAHLALYPEHVPQKIQGLEELRLREIPIILAQRRKDGDAFLEKTELTSLVEWKLKHGTYRPTLLKQVASNSIEDIRTITHDAFATYEGTRENEGHVNAVTALSKLKGVGPATASLLLSCYDPVMVPFFSDELYRYLNWEEDRSKGWDRKIGYTLREYKELWNRLHILRLRLEHEGGQEVKAVDIEKMAYALGKSARQSSSLGKREDIEDDKEAKPPSPKKRRKAALPPHKRPTGMPNERTIRLTKF